MSDTINQPENQYDDSNDRGPTAPSQDRRDGYEMAAYWRGRSDCRRERAGLWVLLGMILASGAITLMVWLRGGA